MLRGILRTLLLGFPQRHLLGSLTSVCCKTMESVLASDWCRILSPVTSCQIGSSDSASIGQQNVKILLVYSDVAAIVDDGSFVDIIILIFLQAFDVSHIVLLEKLRNKGASVVLLDWIWGFLSDCSRCVTVGRVLSELGRLPSGVPQGLVRAYSFPCIHKFLDTHSY